MPRKKRTIVEETLPDEPTLEAGAADTLDFESYKYKVYKLNGSEKSFCFQTEETVDEVSLQAQYPNGGKFAVQILLNGSVSDTDYYTIEPKPLATNGNNSSADDIRVRMLMDELNFTRQLVMNTLTKGQTPMVEMIQALQGLQGLAPAKVDPTELLIKGMELGAKSGGASSDWKSELIHTVKSMAPEVMQTMQSMRANPPAQVQQIEQGETRMLPGMLIQQGIRWIKNQIMAGLEPGLAVDWISQNANDAAYQPFLSLAINGTIDDFIKIDADLANEPYKSWFETAISMLKETYAAATQVSADNSDHGGGNGNGTNVTDNAKSSTGKHNLSKVV